MSVPRTKLSWLALLIPLGYLPGYLSGSRPGLLASVAIALATVVGWWGTAWLASSTERRTAAPRRSAPRWTDRFVWPLMLTAFGTLFVLAIGGAALARVDALGRKEAFSVGIFQQALWWTARGIPLGATYSTADASLHSQFGIHFSPFMMLLAPIYSVRPQASTLLWLQAAFMAVAALPLYEMARPWLGRLGAGLVGLAWLLHPTVIGAPLTGFHDLGFAPVFIFLAFGALLRRRGGLYFVSILALLALREDLAFFVILLGVVAATRRAPVGYSIGAIVLAGLWFAVVATWVMPGYRPPTLLAHPGIFFQQYLGSWGSTPAEVVRFLIAHPLALVKRVLSRDAILYLLAILRPIGLLLPLPDPSWMAGLQSLGLNVVAEGGSLKAPMARYSIPAVAAFFAALPGALAFWGRRLAFRGAAVAEPSAGSTIEERAARLREQRQVEGRRELPWVDAEAGRGGAPAALIAVIAGAAALFVMQMDQQFRPAPRGDLAAQRAALDAIPESVGVLAPDWSYARLANRPVWACLGSVEERALDPAVRARFDAILLDMGPESFELQRYPQLLPALLISLRDDRAFREDSTAGDLHLFRRITPASTSSPTDNGR